MTNPGVTSKLLSRYKENRYKPRCYEQDPVDTRRIGTNLGELDLVSADCNFNYFDLSAGESRKIAVKKESLSEHLRLNSFKEQLTSGVFTTLHLILLTSLIRTDVVDMLLAATWVKHVRLK
ncbi:hypothetical protein KDJ21_025620 [Metabacillus litoralis]|uniref:hypothetical protein n=1 Tax=Metabacillus litoralis TaxID=152268 RepID=UPI001B8F0825|nr:hypothetical protein [Metabacillus litoralis]UHA60052.1 hypothetical protein KDJ21_025620 [Metabacillus litoralis]